MASGAALLQALSNITDYSSLHQLRSDGLRQLDALCTMCGSQQITGSGDGAARYWVVLDGALEHEFGCWIVDYTLSVCGNSSLTSNDPLEAQLLDGTFIQAWCQQVLHVLQQQLPGQLKSEATLRQFVKSGLPKQLSKVNAIAGVLRALGKIYGQSQPLGAEGVQSSGKGVGAEMALALRLLRVLRLLDWAAQHQLLDTTFGVHASLPDWTRRLQSRRTHHLPGSTLFLDDTLEALAMPGAYPFPSLASAVSALLYSVPLPGASAGMWALASPEPGSSLAGGDGGWGCGLALFVYWLADKGLLPHNTSAGRQLLSSLGAAFHVGPAQLAAWHAAQLLDDALSCSVTVGGAGGVNTAAQAAGEVLLGCVPPHLPIKYLQVLEAAGQARAALLLHRAQGPSPGRSSVGPQGNVRRVTSAHEDTLRASLESQLSLVQLRLRNGLLAEAFALVRSVVAVQPDGPSRKETLEVLLGAVLDWSVAARQSQDQQASARMAVLELCCSEEEEAVLVAWLLRALDEGRPEAHLLPLAMVARGRVPEALGAFNRWSAGVQAHLSLTGSANAAAVSLVDSLVDAMAGALPRALASVQLDEGASLPAGLALPDGPQGLAFGLTLVDTHTPSLVASFTHTAGGIWRAPPFITSRAPAPFAWAARQDGKSAATAGGRPQAQATALAGEAELMGLGASVVAATLHPVQGLGAGGEAGSMFGGAAATPQQPPLGSFFSMEHAGHQANGSLAANSGVARSLFSLPGSEGGPGLGLGSALMPPSAKDMHLIKRPRTNAWLQGR